MELLLGLAEPGFDPLEGFIWCLLGVCGILLLLMLFVGDD